MFDENVKSSTDVSGVQSSLDAPVPGQKVYDQAVLISGWVYVPNRDPSACWVRAYINGHHCAETRVLFCRPDVNEWLGLPDSIPTGFRMLGKVETAATESSEATLRIDVSWDNKLFATLAEQPLIVVPASLRTRPYGEVVYPANDALLHRENIYGSGPPIGDPGIEVSNLLNAYLPNRCSVVDVGCGAGAYGPALMARGHDWLGLEANSYCCDILQRRQLPFRRVNLESHELPCATDEWDCAICIEAVEHVREPEIFLREIARVIRGRALFSVPNMEVLPYFHDWSIVPWHLLEADHKNFFTRASLRGLLLRFFRHVEIFPFGEHPVKTRDEIPLHIHLFAVADK